MRSTWCSVLALSVTGSGCQSETTLPALVRIEPSVLPQGELPSSAVILGENLTLGARLSLDNQEAAELASPRVSFNGVNATWVSYHGSDRLDVMLPTMLTPGVYDVNVELDPQRRLVLPAGLHVLANEALGSVSTSQDGSYSSTDPSSATSASPSSFEGATSGAESETDSETETSPDADSSSAPESTFRCGPGDFGQPQPVVVSGYTGTRPWSPTLSSNYFTLYFTDNSSGSEVLWTATRSDRGATFSGEVTTHAMFTDGGIGSPYISPSGLTLYFYSNQTTGAGGGDLYLALRSTPSGEFGGPLALSGLNSPELDYLPWISPDELTIVFVSDRSGASAYYTASRAARFEPFGAPRLLANLTHTENNGRINISSDGLRAYFTSRNRPGGVGLDDVWYATRASTADDFGGITNLGVVNTPGSETQVTVTQDGEELYFIAMGTNESRIYRALATCP